MAAGAKCKVRVHGAALFTDEGVTETNNSVTPEHVKWHEYAEKLALLGKQSIIFDVTTRQANAAVAELSAVNSVLNGSTTPVLLSYVSSQANDADKADGDLRAFRIIGLTTASADPTDDLRITVEECRMHATDGTTVGQHTHRYYVRAIHAYGCAWGTTGDDAAGDIIIQNVAAAITYLTIGAGSNESDGTRIWIPSGSTVVIDEMHAVQVTKTAATRGTLHEARWTGFGLGADPDFATLTFTTTFEKPTSIVRRGHPHVSTDNSSNIAFWQTQLVGAETFEFNADLIVHKT